MISQYFILCRASLLYQNKWAELFHFFGEREATILDTNFTNPHESNRESSSGW